MNIALLKRNPSFSRSTKQFTVYTATTIAEDSWHLALIDNLPSPHGLACDEIPTVGFEINRSGRFMKLTLDSSHGNQGTGLQYVDIIYTKTCQGKNQLKFLEVITILAT